jgi:peptide/nickel transport system substrate-binding protein
MLVVNKLSIGVALASVLALSATPSDAQKARDTLRAASLESVSLIDPVTNAQSGAGPMSRAIQDSLLTYDWEARKYIPLLATTWRNIDDKTIEFDLREDVTFHDGSKFDADDVVDVFNYLAQPNVRFLFKSSLFGDLSSAEKVGPYKVRFLAQRPLAILPFLTGESYRIYPSEKYVGNKDTFGRTPIGTGPYRAVQVDPAKGVILEKHAGFQHGNRARPAGRINRIDIQPIPDQQSQVANMMVGKVDLLSGLDPDIAANLSKNPDLRLSVADVTTVTYFQFDVAGRSGVNFFKDQRVRKALSMAVDRETIKANLLPKEAHHLPLLNSICHPSLLACEANAKPPQYDPAAAKKLLAEAGYPNGFDLTITTFGPTKDLTTAVAGNLRSIGVRANVENLTYTAYTKKRGDGQMQSTIVFNANGAGSSDASRTIDFFFARGERDYFQDETFFSRAGAAGSVTDIEKRTRLYQDMFEDVVAKNYVMPLIPWPSLIIRHKDVVVEAGPRNSEGYQFNALRWAE